MIHVLNAFDKPFCLYGHFIDDRCILIGGGPLERAFSTSRPAQWHDATRGKSVTVFVFDKFNYRFEATDRERELRNTYHPLLSDTLPTHIQCVQTGAVYDTVTAAAKACDVSKSAVSNVLSGRYKSVRGLVFVWC